MSRGADYTVLIGACGRRSRWRLAIGFLQQLLDGRLSHGPALSTALLSSCRQAAEWRQALEHFAGARRPDVVLYGAALAVARWPQALALLRAMRRQRLEANAVAFGAAGAEATWPAATALLAAARCHGLRQSLVAVSSALVACGAQWRRAAQLCQGLRKDVVCHGALLSCNERAQRWEGALQVLRRRFRLPTAFERR